MLDIYFRSLKDQVFTPLCNFVPQPITPLRVTTAAFVFGLASCLCAATNNSRFSVILWLLNRAFDCLDGTLARHRAQSSDLGGFLDLLGDFVVYSLIPIACAGSRAASEAERGYHLWLAVALVEASFHINNFVLFYVAAALEKRKAEAVVKKVKDAAAASLSQFGVEELTSVTMKPALIEGMESGIVFTIMLARPAWTELLCWTMAVLVGVGIGQRVIGLASVM